MSDGATPEPEAINRVGFGACSTALAPMGVP